VEYLIAVLIACAAFVTAYQLLFQRQLARSHATAKVAAAFEVPNILATANPKSLEYRLAEAGIQTDHPQFTWLLINWLPCLSVLAVGAGAGLPLAVLAGAGLVALIAPRRWLSGRAKQRGRRIDEELPTTYARLGSTLRASPDIAAALLEIAESLEVGKGPTPLSTELRLTALEAAAPEIGREEALRRLQRRAASSSLANLGLLLERFGQTAAGEGGSFFDAFQTAAENVQSIIEARQRAQAKSAEQMQAARIVPVLLVLTLVFFSRDPGFRYSFQVPLVQLALALAAVMMYAGYNLMSDMAREAV
jgi:Flp pilus assembly protein TadB